jgi:polyhydroxyalkanoate synthase subunit PhaC
MEAISQFTDSINIKNHVDLSSANNYDSFFTPNTFLSKFVDASNSEINKQLCSKDFLQNFKNYMKSIINLDSIQNRMFHYSSLSTIDSLIDQFLASYNNNLVSSNETPHKVIAQIDGTRVLHYFDDSNESTVSTKYTTPLLMVYAPINRFHILDLSPNRSIVNKFVSAGFDVFLLDWGEEQSKSKLTISDYIDNIEQAVELIHKITKKEKINLYGYSWGGTLSLIYCAFHNSKIKNLILHSTNLDFDKDDTVIAEWTRNFPAEKFSDEFKEMFGHFIDLAFVMRNPIVHSTDRIKYALDMKEYETFQFIQNLIKISSWITNTSDISSQLFKQFSIDLYQKNLLVQNQLSIQKKGKETEEEKIAPVNLKYITVPLLNIIGSKDDLVSPKSSIPINDAVSSKDKKMIEFSSGHIELCISYDAHQNLWPQVTDWLERRSDIM